MKKNLFKQNNVSTKLTKLLNDISKEKTNLDIDTLINDDVYSKNILKDKPILIFLIDENKKKLFEYILFNREISVIDKENALKYAKENSKKSFVKMLEYYNIDKRNILENKLKKIKTTQKLNMFFS